MEPRTSPTRLLSWNVARRDACWEALLEMDVDIALLQEAHPPPAGLLPLSVELSPGPWHTEGAGDRPWRAAVAVLSERVRVEWIPNAPLHEAHTGELAVSLAGTLSAARITPHEGEPFTVVSVYAPWEGTLARSGWIWADASCHRLVSDLSALLPHPTRHRVVVAGDWNVLRGYGEHGDPYAAARYATVFERMEALGLPLVGPGCGAGRQADPWPEELPAGSRNVPTFHHARQTPATATRQLDFVFASRAMHGSIAVCARNAPEEWGPSDHCRIEIEIGGPEDPRTAHRAAHARRERREAPEYPRRAREQEGRKTHPPLDRKSGRWSK